MASTVKEIICISCPLACLVKLTLDDTYYSTLVACVRAIQKGCTSLVDHHASPFHVRGSLNKVKEAMDLAGLRGDLHLPYRKGHDS